MTGSGRRVCVGVVGAPHGVRGEVRIRSETADPLDVAAYGPLTTGDGRKLTIRRARLARNMVVAAIEGIADRDSAGALRNQRLYVDRDRLPATGEDEYYHADLIGLAVRDRDGGEIGTVSAVQDYGGGDLLEIRLAGKGQAATGRTVFVPFTRGMVPAVDVAAGFVVIEAPDGLLDDGLLDEEGEEDLR